MILAVTMPTSDSVIAMYPIVKQIHVWLVLISITLFQFRYWYFKFRAQPVGQVVRILPHAVDTLLLITGVSLAVLALLNPLVATWLGFKLIALLVYIMAGTLAMKKSGSTQWVSYLLATLAVLYMLWTAIHKTAWPW